MTNSPAFPPVSWALSQPAHWAELVTASGEVTGPHRTAVTEHLSRPGLLGAGAGPPPTVSAAAPQAQQTPRPSVVCWTDLGSRHFVTLLLSQVFLKVKIQK